MSRFQNAPCSVATLLLGSALALGGCSSSSDDTTQLGLNNNYVETNLVTDATGATVVDASLINPWGLAFGPTGILWVANNGTGTSTTYDVNGTKQSLTVAIPTTGAITGGTPTGVINNQTHDFVMAGSNPALFIFAGEDGIISGWNAGTQAVVLADRSANSAVYKGIAMATNGGLNFLYATNFKNSTIDVFNTSFQLTSSFTDATIPAGYGPFGIQNINGLLYVTFAKQLGPDNKDDQPGVGNGYVDVFNPDGSLARRFASNGTLNSPWAIALAPTGFGSFGGDILVGNFGDGKINVFNPTSGLALGFLNDPNNATIVIPGLWALTFGPSASSLTLYFSAGPGNESHGSVGTLVPRL